MSNKKLEEMLETALLKENLLNYDINVHGKTNKCDGYLGNIFFITVTGKAKNGTKRVLDVVIKASKESNILRKQIPISEAFKKEIYIYTKVKSVFEKFQEEKRVMHLTNFFSHCYGSGITENSEFLILENLKAHGYDIWNRQIQMTYNHVKLVLQAYGKLHAFSLALKWDSPETFQKLTENNINMFSFFITEAKLVPLFFEWFENAKKNSISMNEKKILEKLQFSENDMEYIFGEMFFEDPDHQVITHGDCWTNNFMFKFQNDTKNPLSVCIIDWQLSGLSSPVIDLSYFLYTCCNTGEYKDIKQLLKIYHDSLSESLRQLGCYSSELFPYDVLIKHWKKYSCYGLIMSSLVLKLSLCEADNAPDFAEAAEQGKEFLENFDFAIKDNEDVYNKRMRDNFLHYVYNLK